MPGLTYPLSRAVDYAPGATHSNFYEPPPSAPKSIQPPFDSHFVAVQRGDYQCVDGVQHGVVPDYDELVLKEASQALPAYRLFFTAPE